MRNGIKLASTAARGENQPGHPAITIFPLLSNETFPLLSNETISMNTEKKTYEPPTIEEWTVASLTQVGNSTSGGDTLPWRAKGNDGGSVYPAGLDKYQ